MRQIPEKERKYQKIINQILYIHDTSNIPSEYKKDKDFLFYAFKNKPSTNLYCFMDDTIKKDYDFILSIVQFLNEIEFNYKGTIDENLWFDEDYFVFMATNFKKAIRIHDLLNIQHEKFFKNAISKVIQNEEDKFVFNKTDLDNCKNYNFIKNFYNENSVKPFSLSLDLNTITPTLIKSILYKNVLESKRIKEEREAMFNELTLMYKGKMPFIIALIKCADTKEKLDFVLKKNGFLNNKKDELINFLEYNRLILKYFSEEEIAEIIDCDLNEISSIYLDNFYFEIRTQNLQYVLFLKSLTMKKSQLNIMINNDEDCIISYGGETIYFQNSKIYQIFVNRICRYINEHHKEYIDKLIFDKNKEFDYTNIDLTQLAKYSSEIQEKINS